MHRTQEISTPRHLYNRLRLTWALLQSEEPNGATPTAAYIEATSRCNLECPMCARQLAGEDWHDRDMTIAEFDVALDALGPWCEHVMPFAGGEPLLHPDIDLMVAACTRRGLRTELATNATLLSKRISRDLIYAGLNTLIISLDAARASTYERIRRGADYERTCSNIMTFLKAKRALGANTWVIIQMIDLPENQGQGRDLRQRWRRVTGVDAVRIKADEVHTGRIKKGDLAPRRPMRPCHFPWLGPLLVRYDGSVYPCCHFWRDEPVGHVSRQSIPEIWNGDAMAALRLAHREGRASEYTGCRDCQAVMPHHLLVTGSLFAPAHVTRRAIPYVEAINRLVGNRLIRS